MEENASVNVPGRVITVKLSRQVSAAGPGGSSRVEQSSAYKQTEEDQVSKQHQILETQYANLGTVSEMSMSNHEFDFSSIEEFKEEEKQEPLNCRGINPFPKIVECKFLYFALRTADVSRSSIDLLFIRRYKPTTRSQVLDSGRVSELTVTEAEII